MKRAAVLLFALLLPLTACARPRDVRINLLAVLGAGSPTPLQMLEIYRDSVSRLRELNLRPRIEFRWTLDWYKLNDEKDYVTRLFVWGEYAKKVDFKDRNAITHIILPAVSSQGLPAMGGLASRVCSLGTSRNFSFSIQMLQNYQGLDYVPRSKIAGLHETLHNLGADHLPGKDNVMDPSVLYYTPTNWRSVPIARETKAQVARCIAKSRVYR